MLCDRGIFWVSLSAGPRGAVGSGSDSRARSLEFNTRSGRILSFLLPLIQEEQLSVTGETCESMYAKYWLTSLPRKSVVRLTDRPDMTIWLVTVDVKHNNNIYM